MGYRKEGERPEGRTDEERAGGRTHNETGRKKMESMDRGRMSSSM